jgi:DNA repair protein RadA/Sms
LKEAGKLGFTRAMVPTGVTDAASVRLSSFRNLASFVDHMLGRG